MKRITTITVAALLITGCGSQPEEPQATQQPTEQEADTSNLDEEEDLPGNGSIGDPIDFTYDDGSESYTITVTKAEEKTLIPNTADNPDWQGEDTGQYQDAKPEAGKKFYYFKYTIKNTGKENTNPMFDYFIMNKNMEQHAQSTLDEEVTYNLNHENSQIPFEGLNPGDQGTLEAVVSIPTNMQPDFIMISDPALDNRGMIAIKTT